MQYRTDIDGLRALAVLSVVLFHLGFLPNGYLGVDIFFVISGFLITHNIYTKSETNSFSILDFYQRRIRRIIPLLLFTTSLALIIGIFLMLPDDLDNLAQSVFASNFSVNNILMYLTSSDYWSVKNDYKPLMHTWSLGIEEQYYLIYPFIFFFLQGKRVKYIQPSLLLLTILSLLFFISTNNTAQKFYLLHHRFFEFTIGGMCAIHFRSKKLVCDRSTYFLVILSLWVALMAIVIPISEYNTFKVIVITLASSVLLVTGKSFSLSIQWYQRVFESKIAMGLGKISFSVYMIHQVVFAFARYAFLEEITNTWAILLSILILGISSLTYHWIENPFRNYQLFSFRKVIVILVFFFVISSITSLYIYSIGGLIKDFPELNLYKGDLQFERKLFKITHNIHIQYNEDVRKLDREFEPTTKKKVLVFGNSYGRDVANILLESEVRDEIQLRYFDIARTFKDPRVKIQLIEADVIFLAAYGSIEIKELLKNIEEKYQFQLDRNKIWVFGIKDFGSHNGIHYNRIKAQTDFSNYRTPIKTGVLEKNDLLKTEWGNKYIDLISPVTTLEGHVLVFTPSGKFISPDTVHLTQSGAKFYTILLEERLKKILFW